MDSLTKEQRHVNMAAIHSKNTKPEMKVRKYLFAHGFRYRVNNPRLPGHPDIVLRKYRTVIFVNGCFWHGHDNCRFFRMPKTNTDFWKRKIERNKERDKRTNVQLKEMGWHRIVIWECQLRTKEKCEETLRSVIFTLNSIWLEDHGVKTYRPVCDEQEYAFAAEGEPEAMYNKK